MDEQELMPPGSTTDGSPIGYALVVQFWWAVLGLLTRPDGWDVPDVPPAIVVAGFILAGLGIGVLMLTPRVVPSHWLTGVGLLVRRHRLRHRTWDSPLPEVKYFELVHRVWGNRKGCTDELLCWVEGRPRPVSISRLEKWKQHRSDLDRLLGRPLIERSEDEEADQWLLRHAGQVRTPVPRQRLSPDDLVLQRHFINDRVRSTKTRWPQAPAEGRTGSLDADS